MPPFSTPYEPLIKTNQVVFGLEREHLRDFLSQHEKRLASIDRNIAVLESTFIQKLDQVGDLLRFITPHRRLLSAARNLPDEIMQNIFRWSITANANPPMDPTVPPLLLTYVCRKWRVMAHGNPQLWCKIHISIPSDYLSPPPPLFSPDPDPTKERVVRDCSRIQTWISRSQTQPLSITFTTDNFWRPATEFQDYVGVLFQYLDRIQTLEIIGGDLNLLEPFLSLTPDRVPLLSTLSLKVIFEPISSDPFPSSTIFYAPNLTRLCLTHFHHSFPAAYKTSWSKLTHLSMSSIHTTFQTLLETDRAATCSSISAHQTHSLLLHCPLLEYVSLSVADDDVEAAGFVNLVDRIPQDERRVVLPFLHTLMIINCSEGFEQLVNLLVFPSLTRISYHTDRHYSMPFFSLPRDPPGVEALRQLLRRVGSQLEELVVDVHAFTYEELMECIELVTELKAFQHFRRELVHAPCACKIGVGETEFAMPISVMDTFLDILSRPRPDLPTGEEEGGGGGGVVNWYLPRLEKLVVKSTFTLQERTVVDFVTRRMEAATSSSSSSPSSSSPFPSPDSRPSLLKMVDVAITDFPSPDNFLKASLSCWVEKYGLVVKDDYAPLFGSGHTAFFATTGLSHPRSDGL